MVCPKCKGNVKVMDVVHNPDTNEILRKRKCTVCGKKFYTVEFEVKYDENVHVEWYKYRRKYIKDN